MRTYLINPVALVLLVACSQPHPASQAIELPLAALDGTSRGDAPAAIELAYDRYANALIAIEGVRLGPGLPAGLGSHLYVGLHEPPSRNESRVLLSGNVPPGHGERYRVVGRIVPAGSRYEFLVDRWEELPP